MGSFPKRLAESLRKVDVRLSTKVQSIEFQGDKVFVLTTDERIEAGFLLLTTPAYVTSKLLNTASPKAAELLGRIRFVSTAVATLAYPRDAFRPELSGNGFLVPSGEPSSISGCTWSSNKWPERAPEETLLIRAFLGRDGGLEIDGYTDEQLVVMAEEELSRLLKPKASPSYRRLDRWRKAMAQYELGHLERVAEIETAIASMPIRLAGASYRGNSIPDCVRQGREAAAALLGSLQ